MAEKLRKYEYRLLFLCGCLLGVVCFIAVYGTKVLDVTYDAWLFYGNIDLQQHYLGWCHFRTTPWQFPIGLIDSLSYPTSVSVIWTDSIPLFALIFKLISPILPETFQYFGIFSLLSFMLQGGISVILVRRFTKNRWLSVVSALFFIMSFPILQRTFYHTSLGAQWLILLALCIVFYKHKISAMRQECLIWSGMAFLCVFIHSYFLPMVMIILVGHLIDNYLEMRDLKKALLILFSYIATALLCLYILGGFYEGATASAPGLGTFSSNLNTFYNSLGHSWFLKGIPLLYDFQYEGFGYLGLGMILLSGVAVSILIYRMWKIKFRFNKSLYARKHTMIIMGFEILAFMALAICPIIALNDFRIIHLPYPGFVEKVLSVFRSNGRFIWGAMFIIMAGALYIVLKYLQKSLAAVLIIACVVIQIMDVSAYAAEKRKEFNAPERIYETMWDTEQLAIVMGGYEHFVFMYNQNDIIMPTAYYAYKHGMTISNYYFARSYDDVINEQMQEYQRELERGIVREDVIYIFREEETEGLAGYNLYYYKIENHIIGVKNHIEGLPLFVG